MLNFAVEHITAINTITADCNMRKYKLSEDDWDIACHLRDVLKVCNLLFLILYLLTQKFYQIFKDVTLVLSWGTPSITTVIPAMDHINKHLAMAATNCNYPLTVKATVAIRKKNSQSFTKLIILISTGSQWVSVFYYFMILFSYIHV